MRRKNKDLEHNCGVEDCAADVVFGHYMSLPKTAGLFPKGTTWVLYLCKKHSKQYDDLHGKPALEF